MLPPLNLFERESTERYWTNAAPVGSYVHCRIRKHFPCDNRNILPEQVIADRCEVVRSCGASHRYALINLHFQSKQNNNKLLSEIQVVSLFSACLFTCMAIQTNHSAFNNLGYCYRVTHFTSVHQGCGLETD